MNRPFYQVLVVEDDPAIRKLLSLALGREGYEVVALDSVPPALDWIRVGRPNLAIFDLNLPGGTGFELIQALRERWTDQQVPIFVLSGLRQENNVVRGLSLGVQEYLIKPFSPLELLVRVRRHLPEMTLEPTVPTEDDLILNPALAELEWVEDA